MMPHFSARSLERLLTCDERLQRIAHEAIKQFDFVVLCGHRNKEDQDGAVASGASLAPWPTSKHNALPARAMDLAPWIEDAPHIIWDNKEGFYRLAGVILSVAAGMNIRIRWGGSWKKLVDLPHFELVDDD